MLEQTDHLSPTGKPSSDDSHALSGRSNSLPAADVFPDGGVKAWSVVVGSFLGFFCSFGWINTLGEFQDLYQNDQLRGLAPSTISWIASLQVFFMMIGGPFWGIWYDHRGPTEVLVTGALLQTLGLMMASISSSFYQLLLSQGVCSAIGASMILHSSVTSVTTWFLQRRALAVGIAVSGSSAGGVIFPILVHYLLADIGFAWTMRTCAFAILGLMAFAVTLIRSRLPVQKRPVSLGRFIAPFRDLTFSLLMLYVFFFYVGLLLPLTYIVVMARTSGLSPTLAFYCLPILNAASFFGRIISGLLADRFGGFNVQIILCLLTSVLDLALWIPAHSAPAIVIFAICFGFSTGAFVSITPGLVAHISDMSEIGFRIGTHYAVAAAATLCSAPVGGALLQRWDGAFTGLQIYCGVMQFVGAVALVLTKLHLARPH